MDPQFTEQDAAGAAHWYVRLRAADCSLAERQAFQSWLAQAPAHALAYEHARRTSRLVDQLATQDVRLRQLAAATAPTLATRAPAPWRFAAAVLLALGLAILWTLQGDLRTQPVVAQYANTGMQQQQVDLPDGSRVYLDVGARLDVQMTPTGRLLDLHAGRAYFEVAHDAARPFAVVAGGVRTVALGTRFQVAVAARGITVTLAEGSVAVSMQDRAEWQEILRPGEQLRLGIGGGERVRSAVDAAAVTGWSTGRLVFKGAPLSEVLADINRYTPLKLRLGDESLGQVPVGGTFIAGADSARVAAALGAVLPLNAVQVGAREIVLVRRYEAVD
jgi:transmembrane sensor